MTDYDKKMLQQLKEHYPDAKVVFDQENQVAIFKLHDDDPGVPFDYSPLSGAVGELSETSVTFPFQRERP